MPPVKHFSSKVADADSNDIEATYCLKNGCLYQVVVIIDYIYNLNNSTRRGELIYPQTIDSRL